MKIVIRIRTPHARANGECDIALSIFFPKTYNQSVISPVNSLTENQFVEPNNLIPSGDNTKLTLPHWAWVSEELVTD